MALHIPSLVTLRIFEAAAQLRSFKLAAAALGLTPRAVSHRIVALEKWLEIELFQRGGRNVMLMSAGRQLLPYLVSR
jgi:LysR family glycine cleavage system transcriptional activator